MEPPLTIVALAFPNITQLDLTGPAQVFSRYPDAELHIAWHRTDPVATDSGFMILPTTTFAQAPQADVLFVPGGQGAFELFDDAEALEFIRGQAGGAQHVTSVCTGSFVLAAAGLLEGRKATSHWASLHMLSQLGATPVERRVVRDGNLLTGAGITSGIDFALTLASEIYGDDVARGIQLALEYDPAPPFGAGSPARPEASQGQVQEQVEAMTALRSPMIEEFLRRS